MRRGRLPGIFPNCGIYFGRKKTVDKIPNKKGNEILALYTDYEGDYSQPFNYMICCEVTSIEDVPLGMVAKIIPTADYTILKAMGKFPDCLIKTWKAIWQSDLKRTYRYDFEVYKTLDPNLTEIDIYIGVSRRLSIFIQKFYNEFSQC